MRTRSGSPVAGGRPSPARGARETSRHVALLRGINVGGRNRVLMADLVTFFEEAGARAVRTYIQSGNVIFDASPAGVEKIREQVRRALRERLDIDVPIAVRTSEQLRAVIEGNPFLERGCEPEHLHVGFLTDAPDRAGAESLDPERSEIDSFALVGRELYLHVPGGMARTRLTTAYFDARLATSVTVRNWRTATRLAEMST